MNNKFKISVRVLVLVFIFTTLFGSISTSYASQSNYPVSLDSLWNNQCYWVQDNVNTKMAYNTRMIFMDFLNTQIGGQYYVYYIDTQGGEMGTGLATSTDGVNFNDQGYVIHANQSYDSTYAAFAGSWYDNGTYYLTYEASPGINGGADVALATSTDGRNFTKQGVILENAHSGWEAGNIGTPDLYKEGSTWYLTYHGYDGNDCKVGFASGSNIYSLSKSGANPIISTSGSGFDSGTIGRRGIYKEGSYYYMVYEVSTDAPYNTADWSCTIARSSNWTTWTKFSQQNIIPVKTSSEYGNDGPDLINIGGTFWMYYRDVNDAVPSISYTKRAKLVNETVIDWTDRCYEAESMNHQIGRADADGWSANTSQDNPGFLVYGPYASDIPTGENLACFKMSIDNNTMDNNNIVKLEVYDATTDTMIASKDITRQMFKQTNHYEFFTLPYTIDASRSGHQMEYRIYWYKTSYIKADRVIVKFGDSNPHAGPGGGGGGTTLFTTGLESGQTQLSWTNSVDLIANVVGYSGSGSAECALKQDGGDTVRGGSKSIGVAGYAQSSSSSNYCYFKTFNVNIPIQSSTYLEYYINPHLEGDGNGRYVGIDFHCTDGTTLRDSGAVDQNGYGMHPGSAHGGNIPINSYSLIRSNVGQWLANKTVDKIWIAYDHPNYVGQFHVYIDDIKIYNQ
jgi:predicted GH43/DUF377 family glycosyl hydrolase